MKKLKKGILAIAIITGVIFMLNSNESKAQTIDGESWVCCQQNSTGCITMYTFMWFPDDYVSFNPTCS